MCFLKEGKSDQATMCIKSRIMTKVIDSVLKIDKFEQKCVVLKDMLQSPRLKYHVHTIGIHRSLSKKSIYEHKCLEKIKRLYKQAGKCEYQQQFKYIVEDAMVSTPEVFTDNSPISPMNTTPIKKPSTLKSMCMFNNILDVNKKLLTIKLELLNLSARRLNMEIHYGSSNKIEKYTKK